MGSERDTPGPHSPHPITGQAVDIPLPEAQPVGRRDAIITALRRSDTSLWLDARDRPIIADIVLRALDNPAAAAPEVNATEGARRVYVNVTAALGPFYNVLRNDLDALPEPSEAETEAVDAIHDVQRAAHALSLALDAAARKLNVARRTVRVEYVH